MRGEFHTIEPNQPIRNEAGKLCGVTNPRRLVHTHSYGSEHEFFDGVAQGRLLGTRCDNADCEVGYQSVFVPFRIHCPDCLQRTTTVDLTEVANRSGTVHSFMITERTGAFNTLEKPIKFINIEFEGVCTILMSYLLCGEPAIGDRVVPIFAKSPTYTIVDLAWVPEGTPESELPEGFSFSR
jgi:uncharacterized OB-fold protein